MRRLIPLSLVLLAALTFASCELVGDVLAFGFWAIVILLVIVIAIVWWIFAELF